MRKGDGEPSIDGVAFFQDINTAAVDRMLIMADRETYDIRILNAATPLDLIDLVTKKE